MATFARAEIQVTDRKYHFTTYKQCFIGKEMVSWLKKKEYAKSDDEAVELGQVLLANNIIMHVCRDHDFKNEGKFYRFFYDEKDRGHVEEGTSWHGLLGELGEKGELEGEELVEILGNRTDWTQKIPLERLPPILFDKHNCDLMDQARPIRWVDPLVDPASKYDILVIGGGAGGLVTAFGAVGTGARVGMIERSLMGGDCLNTGCVPSKAFIKAASVAHQCKTALEYGVIVGEVKIDFKAVMERMRRIRADIAEADSCKRVSTAGIDMFLG